MFKLREGLETLKSYSIEEGDWAVKLDANECADNLPALVLQQVAERLAALPFNRYPEITQYGLRQQIAASLGLTAENVAIGNGSSQLLQALCYIFGGPGRKLLFPHPSFSMYSIYAKLADAQPVLVELEPDYSLPPEKVLAAIRREKPHLVVLCNPNNPTGTVMPLAAVEAVVAGSDCPVVVDEAYCEFHSESAVGLLAKYSNLIVARTFSKAYGLASARVGYALASVEITAALSKVLLPFNINMLSLTAASVVFAARDQFAGPIARTVAERESLAKALAILPGFQVYPSATNFLLIKTAAAPELAAGLAAKGICIRDFSKAPGLEGCLRVTVGTAAENDAFLAAVRDFGKK
ncbi:MAG: histidinol-phosphate transaminase [Negativicutes bacterium]|nr:histidinol-phosphate transaminase [Negativicutes bacterium]